MIMCLTYSMLSFADDAARILSAKNFVNQEVSDIIGLLNKSFTSLNITDCTTLNSSRANDAVTLTNQTMWDGGVQYPGITLNLSLDYSQPVTKAGLTKRVDIHIGGNLGAIVQFSCDLKKGYLLQTGKNQVDAAGKIPGQGGWNSATQGDDPATADLLEVYWDNTNGNRVDFMLVGPSEGNVFAQRDTAGGIATLVIASAFPSISQAKLDLFNLDKTLFGGWPTKWSDGTTDVIFVP